MSEVATWPRCAFPFPSMLLPTTIPRAAQVMVVSSIWSFFNKLSNIALISLSFTCDPWNCAGF